MPDLGPAGAGSPAASNRLLRRIVTAAGRRSHGSRSIRPTDTPRRRDRDRPSRAAAVSTCRRLRGNDTDSACPAPPRVRVFYGDTLRTALRAALDAGYHNEAVVGGVLADYDRSPAQVVLRWAIERDAVVLPKSSSPEHVRANTALFDWSLDPEDRRKLDERDRDEPVYDTGTRDWTDDVWGIPE